MLVKEKKLELTNVELDIMSELIKNEYPIEMWNNYYKLAKLINEEFQVNVNVDDLVELRSVSREEEDLMTHMRVLGYY